MCLGILVSVLKHYAIIGIAMIYFCLQMATICESYVHKTKKSKSFLGILTSFTSPCLIVKEDSKHFLINGLIGCVLYIASIWIVYFNISDFRNLLPNNTSHQHPLIIECHYNFTTSSILRCPINAKSLEDCQIGLFSLPNQIIYTICPRKYGQWYLLWLACFIVTGTLIVSFSVIVFLHFLIDQERLMFLADKIGINTCPESDIGIKQYVIEIFSGKSYEDVNLKAIEATGKPLLDLFVQSRRFHFVKVIYSLVQKDPSTLAFYSINQEIQMAVLSKL